MNRPQPPFPPLLAVLGLLLVAWLGLTQTASAVFLPPDHSDLFAATLSPGGHQETAALPAENRVWENFGNSNEITPADELNSLQLRWESDFGELENASGVLSYADGNPISLSDPFGLCAQDNRCTSGQTYGSGSVPYPKWNDTSPWVYGTLDGFGLIPGAGEFADGANAAIYLAEGNKLDAGISAAAMIPFVGWGATGSKAVRYADEFYEIGDGVRRAKAAEMAGNTHITANIYDQGGQLIGNQNIPIDRLLSPNKSAIDVRNLQEIERFGSVHDATLKGMPLPPISVTRGSQGVPVSEIIFNWGR